MIKVTVNWILTSLVLILAWVPSTSLGQEFSVMTYNVENLFDTSDDAGKDDAAYLPFEKKTNLEHVKACMKVSNPAWALECYYWDWNEAQYGLKLRRLAEVIDAAEAARTIDVLVLQEVENLRVLEDLNRILKKPFPYILHRESSDRRGIDVAFMSRWKADEGPSLHRIPFKSSDSKLREDSREILFARLSVGEFKVSVFGVHFPAPHHRWSVRRDALEYLNELERKLVPPNQLSVVAGDFNIPSDELKTRGYARDFWKGRWLVSHLEGCANCPGSHYWEKGKSWSFLDMILVKNPPSGRWQLLKESIEMPRLTKDQVTEDGKPWGWDMATYKAGGVSDHLPVRLTVKRQ